MMTHLMACSHHLKTKTFKLNESTYSFQHTQTGPDPVFGLAVGLRAQDPDLYAYAGLPTGALA